MAIYPSVMMSILLVLVLNPHFSLPTNWLCLSLSLLCTFSALSFESFFIDSLRPHCAPRYLAQWWPPWTPQRSWVVTAIHALHQFLSTVILVHVQSVISLMHFISGQQHQQLPQSTSHFCLDGHCKSRFGCAFLVTAIQLTSFQLPCPVAKAATKGSPAFFAMSWTKIVTLNYLQVRFQMHFCGSGVCLRTIH